MNAMLNRRRMLRNSALGLAALALNPVRALGNMNMNMSPGGSSPWLTLYKDALNIPPVLKPEIRGKTHYYTVTLQTGLARTHSDLPPTPVWGFNGLYPGPTIKATKGQPVVVRFVSQLPDTHGMNAEASAEIGMMYPAVHLHGAHVAPEDDGHPLASVPGMTQRDYNYPNNQRAATLLYHDHTHGQTGLHVYHGLAGLYLIDDPEEQNLGLPGGDYDIPLLIQDRLFNKDGSFSYVLDKNTRETGMLGDRILVNGVVQPHFKVARRKYRFRIVNASNARVLYLQLETLADFIQIGTDGGLLPKPVKKRMIELSPFQRADVVLDFSGYTKGAKVVMRNCQDCLWCPKCTGPSTFVMRFDVEDDAEDNSTVPTGLSPWQNLPVTARTVTREFTLTRKTTPDGTVWMINGQTYDMKNPPLIQVKHGDVEKWKFVNLTGHQHPIHIHLIQFQVLDINGVPQDPSLHGWRDVLVAPPNGHMTVVARYAGYTGRYLFHCHNLEHEDLGMMADYEIVP
ncbi:MAG TPA: multicopper oxidase family protein [Verrucomicrobiota bacterium]|nr:multicopper oxidase family protein [Verrucomicrobiota bacterium]